MGHSSLWSLGACWWRKWCGPRLPLPFLPPGYHKVNGLLLLCTSIYGRGVNLQSVSPNKPFVILSWQIFNICYSNRKPILIIFSNCSLSIVLISLDFTSCPFFLLLSQLKYHAVFSQHVFFLLLLLFWRQGFTVWSWLTWTQISAHGLCSLKKFKFLMSFVTCLAGTRC